MRVAFIICCAALAGCAEFQTLFPAEPAPDPAPVVAAAAPTRSAPAQARPPSDGPIPTADRSVETPDTTTAEERAAATAPASRPSGAVGTTVAGLGDPAQPGFWIETPLVDSEGPGRVVLSETGAAAQVKLIPIDGPATAGSRLSLAAMRLLEAPLSDLVEVQVFAEG